MNRVVISSTAYILMSVYALQKESGTMHVIVLLVVVPYHTID